MLDSTKTVLKWAYRHIDKKLNKMLLLLVPEELNEHESVQQKKKEAQ